jgi:hypothetical protein
VPLSNEASFFGRFVVGQNVPKKNCRHDSSMSWTFTGGLRLGVSVMITNLSDLGRKKWRFAKKQLLLDLSEF